MANLGKFSIETNGDWEKLEEIVQTTFSEGEVYCIQLNKGEIAQFCEKDSTPEADEGFEYFGNQQSQIKYTVDGGADLYVKNLTSNCKINIAKNVQ